MSIDELKVVEGGKFQPVVTAINKSDHSETLFSYPGHKLFPTGGNLKPRRDTLCIARGIPGAVNELGPMGSIRKSFRNVKDASKEAQLASIPADGSKPISINLHNDENNNINDSPSGDKVLFSPEIVKSVLGNGQIENEDFNTQMISCEGYILVSQEYHPGCPQRIGEDGSLQEISGGEYFKEIDYNTIFPVFQCVPKSLHYFGNYKLGEHEIMPGWRLLVQAGLVGASEMRNLSLNEILGWFRLSSKEGGLRMSITRLIFDAFSNEINDTLLDTAASFASRNQEEPKFKQPQKPSKLTKATITLPAPTPTKQTQKMGASISSVGPHGDPSDAKRKCPRIGEKLADYPSDGDYIPPRSQSNMVTSSMRAKKIRTVKKNETQKDEMEEADGGEEEDKMEEDEKQENEEQ
ncbi:hypothetical protein RUND412_005323 [Rhizina undulata]